MCSCGEKPLGGAKPQAGDRERHDRDGIDSDDHRERLVDAEALERGACGHERERARGSRSR